jgi:hypothetical protein
VKVIIGRLARAAGSLPPPVYGTPLPSSAASTIDGPGPGETPCVLAFDMLTALAAVALSTAWLASAPAAGDGQSACACPDPFAPGTPPGIVWRGPSPGPGLPALARLLAPVLWYSSDEPLIVLRPDARLPHPHPCDETAHAPVVYYQVGEIVLRGSERVSGTGEADTRFFEKVDHFALTFYFYYDEDVGLSPHAHDLEAVTLSVYLESSPDGCLQVRVRRVKGHAHGLDWYSNILDVERDTVFPVTVLVEEGKHASVPDRNADGVYTPGYDVNARVNDAWGLRDVLGSSVLLGARYTASMSKPRDDRFRLMPPDDPPVCTRRPHTVARGAEALGRYVLRHAAAVPVCRPAGPEADRLRSMMRYHRFGTEWPPSQHESDLARELSDPENAIRWISAVNVRFESSRLTAVVQGPGIDMREAWVVPRLVTGYRAWGVDALVTPSASRWADWYVAAGYERGSPARVSDEPGTAPPRNGFAGEVGLKFRVTVTGKARWALLGYSFGGVRVGVRASGFTRLRDPRFIVELGAGAF